MKKKLSQAELFKHLVETGKIDPRSLPRPLTRAQKADLAKRKAVILDNLTREEAPPF